MKNTHSYLRNEIANIDIEFEESKWQPAPNVDVFYIDFKIVREGMDNVLALLGEQEKELRDYFKNEREKGHSNHCYCYHKLKQVLGGGAEKEAHP